MSGFSLLVSLRGKFARNGRVGADVRASMRRARGLIHRRTGDYDIRRKGARNRRVAAKSGKAAEHA
ncbi:hypothetical protein, partial [Burkholderia pyrrocinia]|uniref:hypothetical protein n=1 Tax=Burkholderia pyrrocinia TaxID=60550 RepID=UPI001A9D99E1